MRFSASSTVANASPGGERTTSALFGVGVPGPCTRAHDAVYRRAMASICTAVDGGMCLVDDCATAPFIQFVQFDAGPIPLHAA